MRRVLAYHAWHANWWEELAFARLDLTSICEEGYAGYAYRQASIRRSMRDDCQLLWRNVAAFVNGEVEADAL